MTKDRIAELRKAKIFTEGPYSELIPNPLVMECCDEIESLQKENERLRNALELIIDINPAYDPKRAIILANRLATQAISSKDR